MIAKGMTKTGSDFLRGDGWDEEKPVDGEGEGGPSFVPTVSELRTGEGGGMESRELWRGGSGEEMFW